MADIFNPFHIGRAADDGGDKGPELVGLTIFDELHIVAHPIDVFEVVYKQMMWGKAATKFIGQKLIW